MINMTEEVNLGSRLRKIDETRNYHLEEIKHNDSMNEKYKITYKYLNYVIVQKMKFFVKNFFSK